MKKLFLAILMIVGFNIVNAQENLIEDYGHNYCTVNYGSTKVWVEVDGSWVETILYETLCPICNHYFECCHRSHYRNIYLISPYASIVGYEWYFARPPFRPYRNRIYESRSHKPFYSHNHNHNNEHMHNDMHSFHPDNKPMSRPSSSNNHNEVHHYSNTPHSSGTTRSVNPHSAQKQNYQPSHSSSSSRSHVSSHGPTHSPSSRSTTSTRR